MKGPKRIPKTSSMFFREARIACHACKGQICYGFSFQLHLPYTVYTRGGVLRSYHSMAYRISERREVKDIPIATLGTVPFTWWPPRGSSLPRILGWCLSCLFCGSHEIVLLMLTFTASLQASGLNCSLISVKNWLWQALAKGWDMYATTPLHTPTLPSLLSKCLYPIMGLVVSSPEVMSRSLPPAHIKINLIRQDLLKVFAGEVEEMAMWKHRQRFEWYFHHQLEEARKCSPPELQRVHGPADTLN